jgi:hypothetical protein
MDGSITLDVKGSNVGRDRHYMGQTTHQNLVMVMMMLWIWMFCCCCRGSSGTIPALAMMLWMMMLCCRCRGSSGTIWALADHLTGAAVHSTFKKSNEVRMDAGGEEGGREGGREEGREGGKSEGGESVEYNGCYTEYRMFM